MLTVLSPCKVNRIPGSKIKIFLIACKIRVFRSRNPESGKTDLLEIRKPLRRNQSSTWADPESTSWNPESKSAMNLHDCKSCKNVTNKALQTEILCFSLCFRLS